MGLGRPVPGLRLLLYHSVGPRLENDWYGMTIPPQLFHMQMLALKHHRLLRVVPLRWPPEEPATATSVVVTFDDGYRDTLLTAAPILADLGLPFTVFITRAYVRSGDPCYLTVKQLKRLAQVPGCTIGSHALTHRPLTMLDHWTLKYELRESRWWLEDKIGKPVTMLSYPHGAVNAIVLEAVQDAGYVIGAGSGWGINTLRCQPLVLRRTEVLRFDTLRMFQQKVAGAWDWRRLRHSAVQATDWVDSNGHRMAMSDHGRDDDGQDEGGSGNTG